MFFLACPVEIVEFDLWDWEGGGVTEVDFLDLVLIAVGVGKVRLVR